MNGVVKGLSGLMVVLAGGLTPVTPASQPVSPSEVRLMEESDSGDRVVGAADCTIQITVCHHTRR